MLPNQEEANLWSQIRNGYPDGLNALFDKYNSLLFSYGYLIHPDRELVKDAIQDLFLDIWNRRFELKEVHQLQAFLLTALRRIIFRRLEHQRRIQRGTENHFAKETGSRIDSWIKEEEEIEWKNKLRAKLSELPSRQKEALFLRYYRNLEYDEISQIMSLNYQVVRNLVHRGIKRLRQQLAEGSYWIPFCLMAYFF